MHGRARLTGSRYRATIIKIRTIIRGLLRMVYRMMRETCMMNKMIKMSSWMILIKLLTNRETAIGMGTEARTIECFWGLGLKVFAEYRARCLPCFFD